MLIRNGLSMASSTLRFTGNTAQGGQGSMYSSDFPNGVSPSLRRGFSMGEGTMLAGESLADKAGIPNGYEPPYSWLMPMKAGGLSTYNAVHGEGTLAGSMTMGKAIAAALSGSGSISAASLSLVVQLAAALSGLGTVSSATMRATIALAAALEGDGDVTAAALSLIVSIEADIAASGGLSGSLLGIADIEADIIVTGDLLNTANVAAAVWGALAAFNNSPGSMGEQLNNAGASGDPWDAPIEGTYTAGDILRIVSAVLAGKVSGAPTGPVAFRDINDTTTRVSATVDSSGNRTAVVIDEA